MEEILQQKSDQKKFTAALGYFLLKINVESSVSSMFSAFLLQLSLFLSLSLIYVCCYLCLLKHDPTTSSPDPQNQHYLSMVFSRSSLSLKYNNCNS